MSGDGKPTQVSRAAGGSGHSVIVGVIVGEAQRSGAPVVVDGMPDEFVLQLAEEAEIKAREAERSKLRLAALWAERHAVDEPVDAAHWSDVDPRDIDEAIGGAGTPLVSAVAVEPLAGSLSVSSRTAMQLMSDGLDIWHRLPQTRAAVEELRLAPWRARQIAQLTHRLGIEAAAYVDAQVAPIADRAGRARIERLVNDAAARFDAEEQAAAEDAAKDTWCVRLDHYAGTVWAGTSRLEIIGDTRTLTTFYDLVNHTAHALLDESRPAEDQAPLEHRKVAALDAIADVAGATSRTKLYLHLDRTALTDPALGYVERLGPLSAETIRGWLAGQRFTLQRVLDLARTDAVDQHDPPPWMRELVILRDRTCVHPPTAAGTPEAATWTTSRPSSRWTTADRRARPGPPTWPRSARRHHRAKTRFGWTYQRTASGSYTRTDPWGRTYDVTPP